MAPAGFRLAVPAEVLTGAALIGQAVLYRWPTEDWVRGTRAAWHGFKFKSRRVRGQGTWVVWDPGSCHVNDHSSGRGRSLSSGHVIITTDSAQAPSRTLTLQ